MLTTACGSGSTTSAAKPAVSSAAGDLTAVSVTGAAGAPSAGLGPTDTTVIVVESKSVRNVLARATGAAVAPQAGLPTVALAGNGKPTITVPATAPPARLVVQPLLTGTGPKVAKGQQ